MKNIILIIASIVFLSCNNKGDNNNQVIDYSKAEEFFISGKKKMRYKDNRGALQDFKKVLELDSEHYDACMYAAKCNEFLGKKIDAGRYYSRAILIKPNFGEAYYFRGLNLLEIGRDSACYDFSKSAELGYSRAKQAILKYCN